MTRYVRFLAFVALIMLTVLVACPPVQAARAEPPCAHPGSHEDCPPRPSTPVVPHNPFGWLDEVSVQSDQIRVRGWAIDPDTKEPIAVHVYVDNTFVVSWTADQSRPDVAAAKPGYGDRHGFDATISTKGRNVCVYGINQGPGRQNSRIGCGDTMRWKLRIMTWNIAEGSMTGHLKPNESLAAIARRIRALSPDIVLLNEVKNWDLTAGGGAGDYVRQAQWLGDATGLPYYQWVNTTRTGWTGHKAVAVLSRFPLTSPITHLVKYKGTDTGFGTIETTFMFDGMLHRVFSTRFSPVHWGSKDHDYRRELAENIAGHEQAIQLLQNRGPSTPVIFGGDFNTAPDSPQMINFVANSGITDADPAHTSNDTPDYIFYRGPYQVNSFARKYSEEENVSDHAWVFVELQTIQDGKLQDGSLLREQSSAPVYVIFGGAKFHVASPDVLRDLYGGWSNVKIVPDGSLASVPTIPRDSTILREQSAANVYVVESGTKRHITTPMVLQRYGGWSVVHVVPVGALNAIPNGLPVL